MKVKVFIRQLRYRRREFAMSEFGSVLDGRTERVQKLEKHKIRLVETKNEIHLIYAMLLVSYGECLPLGCLQCMPPTDPPPPKKSDHDHGQPWSPFHRIGNRFQRYSRFPCGILAGKPTVDFLFDPKVEFERCRHWSELMVYRESAQLFAKSFTLGWTEGCLVPMCYVTGSSFLQSHRVIFPDAS